MKYFSLLSRGLVVTLMVLVMPSFVLAADPAPVAAPSFLQSGYLKTAGDSAGVPTTGSLPQIVGSVINILLGLLGILLFGYLLYAGFLWMTSGGSEDNVKKAQTMIKNAVIGLLIIVSAYAISSFVLDKLMVISGTPPAGGQQAPPF